MLAKEKFFDEFFGKIIGGESFDAAFTRWSYEQHLFDKGANMELPEMKFAVEIASRGGTDMVIEWLLDEMKLDKKQLQTFQKTGSARRCFC